MIQIHLLNGMPGESHKLCTPWKDSELLMTMTLTGVKRYENCLWEYIDCHK